MQPCNIDHAGEASDEFGLLTQLITQAQEAIENANNAAEEAAATAESTATTVATNIINQQKSQPNGLATLNSSGKLAQMPTAADVGAVLPNLLLNPEMLLSIGSGVLSAADVEATDGISAVSGFAVLSAEISVLSETETVVRDVSSYHRCVSLIIAKRKVFLPFIASSIRSQFFAFIPRSPVICAS